MHFSRKSGMTPGHKHIEHPNAHALHRYPQIPTLFIADSSRFASMARAVSSSVF
jgi:hypothetical protein